MASIMRKGDTPTPPPIYPTVFDVLFVADMNGLVRTGHPTSKELTKPRDYKPMLQGEGIYQAVHQMMQNNIWNNTDPGYQQNEGGIPDFSEGPMGVEIGEKGIRDVRGVGVRG